MTEDAWTSIEEADIRLKDLGLTTVIKEDKIDWQAPGEGGSLNFHTGEYIGALEKAVDGVALSRIEAMGEMRPV